MKNRPATKEQVIAINVIFQKRGMMDEKANIIDSFTNGRTTHSNQLYFNEAHTMLQSLNADKPLQQGLNKMARKLIAMAHEVGYVKKASVVTGAGEIVEKNDYTRLNDWMLKYGYLHKPLKDYTYEELPKLLTQYTEVYKSIMSSI